MHIDDLRPAPGAFKAKKRVGRGHGSGSGKTSGRGQKGQGARSGGSVRPGFEGGQNPIYLRMPYKRGFTNIFRTQYEILNVGRIAELGLEGTITPEALEERGVIDASKKLLKVLGNGEVDAPLHIRAHKFSASAKEKIEAAGGTAEVIE